MEVRSFLLYGFKGRQQQPEPESCQINTSNNYFSSARDRPTTPEWQADLQGTNFKPPEDTLQQPSNETAARLWPSESAELNKVVPLPAGNQKGSPNRAVQ